MASRTDENINDCSKCGRYVRHGGVFCTGLCKSWVHLRCIDLAYSAVKDLKKEELEKWKCPVCQQESTEEPVNSLKDVENSDLELSLSLAADIGNALLHENEDLKQELHNIKNSKSSRELELEDKIMQKEEEIEELNKKYNLIEKQLYEENTRLKARLKTEQTQKAELIILCDQEKEEYRRDIQNSQNQCKPCKIYQEEVSKMLSSIKSLEEVIEVLQKDNVDLQTKLKADEKYVSKCLKCFPPVSNKVQAHTQGSDQGFNKVVYKRGRSVAQEKPPTLDNITKSSFTTQNPFAALSHIDDDLETSITNTDDKARAGEVTLPRMLLCTDSHASKATRDLHTRHGMHLNRTGKLWLVSKICEAAREKADSPSPPSEEPSNSEQPATVDNTPGSPQQSAVPGSTAGNLPMAVQHLMT
ncbi:hypothetical protein J6590_076883 [Homalodisca vitripennis]|nr:hypothetical protein J6590_076883 [Homalodisca vitripennis]